MASSQSFPVPDDHLYMEPSSSSIPSCNKKLRLSASSGFFSDAFHSQNHQISHTVSGDPCAALIGSNGVSFPPSASSSSCSSAAAPATAPLPQIPFDYSATFASSSAPADEVKDLHPNLSGGGMAMPGTKTKLCTKFFSTSGCPYGEMCHFLHFVPGGMAAAAGGKNPAAAADPSVTVNGYKTRLCNRFGTPEGCRYGENCHFAHGEADIRRPASRHTAAAATSYPAIAAATLPPYASIPIYNAAADASMSASSGCYAGGGGGAVSSAAAAFNPAFQPSPASTTPFTSSSSSSSSSSSFCYPITNFPSNYAPPASSQPGLSAAAYPPTLYTTGFVNAELLLSQQTVIAAPPTLSSDTGGAATAYGGYGGEPTPPGVTVVAPPAMAAAASGAY